MRSLIGSIVRDIKNGIAAAMSGTAVVQPRPLPAAEPLAQIVDEERKLEKSGADYGASQRDYRYLHARYTGTRVDVLSQLQVQVVPSRVRLLNRSIWCPDVSGFIKSRLRSSPEDVL